MEVHLNDGQQYCESLAAAVLHTVCTPVLVQVCLQMCCTLFVGVLWRSVEQVVFWR